MCGVVVGMDKKMTPLGWTILAVVSAFALTVYVLWAIQIFAMRDAAVTPFQ